MGAAVPIIGIGLSVMGVLGQKKSAKEQASIMREQAAAQQRQAELERKRADISNARTLRASLRSSRIARGNLINYAGSEGLLSSSGFQGGIASLGSQEGANRGYFAQQGQFNEAVFKEQHIIGELGARMGGAQARGANAAAMGGIGGMLTQLGGGYAGAITAGKSLFGIA